MRGKLPDDLEPLPREASTPAYAGQTAAQQRWVLTDGPLPPHMRGKLYLNPGAPITTRLYPRICGANHPSIETCHSGLPLPPHMRGKLTIGLAHAPVGTSTPAYAGQTIQSSCALRPAHLYPRICGANTLIPCPRSEQPPLPPHMRGKPRASRWGGTHRPSTPAYAGQTVGRQGPSRV